MSDKPKISLKGLNIGVKTAIKSDADSVGESKQVDFQQSSPVMSKSKKTFVIPENVEFDLSANLDRILQDHLDNEMVKKMQAAMKPLYSSNPQIKGSASNEENVRKGEMTIQTEKPEIPKEFLMLKKFKQL